MLLFYKEKANQGRGDYTDAIRGNYKSRLSRFYFFFLLVYMCPRFYCDWPMHHQRPSNISVVNAFLSFKVTKKKGKSVDEHN